MRWWTIDPKTPTKVNVDADAYNEKAIAELQEIQGDLSEDQRHEIVRQWRIFDLGVELRAQGKLVQGAVMDIRHTGSKKWKVQDQSVEFSRETSALARELYKKARGYSPA